MNLLKKIADFENLLIAFKDCSRGKRRSGGYQYFLLNYGENLLNMSEEILSTQTYNWGGYREFYVTDPKLRKIMAAPFKDRIVHTAIHNMINPIIDPLLGERTYACRTGKGSRHAVIRLLNQLKVMGKKRYCIKLDVQKYFESINHQILYQMLNHHLPDSSCSQLIQDLLKTHTSGIPIGNLTSQLFANFYLSPLDKLACYHLGINFNSDDQEPHALYLRYMDDMVIVADKKELAIDTARKLLALAENFLELRIPSRKYMSLSNDPIPFLGFVLSETGYRPLKRNVRRFEKRQKRITHTSLSYQAQVAQSYQAWKQLQ